MRNQLIATLLICTLTTSTIPAQVHQPVDQEVLARIQALEDARRDAKSDYNQWFYMGYGCCFGVFGFIYEYIDAPTVRTERILGKSPEYITIYSTEYLRIARRRQLGYTAVGALSWIVYGSSLRAALAGD